MTYRKKLIEVALPLDAINAACVREGYIYRQHPTVLHKWWAQRPAAACSSVLFAQVIDDPSSDPVSFPTTQEQDAERERLFSLIARMVTWEARHDRSVIAEVQWEVAKAIAKAKGLGLPDSPEMANEFLSAHAPWVLDPFAGGGTIPLEAQRMGLPAYAQDLNPIPVLLNGVLIDYPQRFLGAAAANGTAPTGLSDRPLAVDFAEYGRRLIGNLQEVLGNRYRHPKDERTILAWIWCRTVPSPDPSFAHIKVPLISNFWLWKKKGRNTWLKPVVSGDSWRFTVETGEPPDRKQTAKGTKVGTGTFRCLLSGATIDSKYIRSQGMAGKLGFELVCVVSKVGREKVFEAASEEHIEAAAFEATSGGGPPLPAKALGFRVQKYGITSQDQLYIPRQWAFLAAAAEEIDGLHKEVERDAVQAGFADDGVSLEDGGAGARAYADLHALLLTFAVSKLVDYHCALVPWYANEARTSHLFTKQAVPMAWDFVENNPLADVGGSLVRNISLIGQYLEVGHVHLTQHSRARVVQASATNVLAADVPPVIICTDPPYYDNVPYADLSDLFYYWVRRCLRSKFPEVTRTILVPKDQELIAEPARTGSPEAAETFFMNGMKSVLRLMAHRADDDFPITIFYAFKQAEAGNAGQVSTGWETFLAAVVGAGLQITGTWPVRTERNARSRGQGSNALATSVVLVCRRRPEDAPTVSAAGFQRLLRRELPAALDALWSAGVAPVDMAQASIGPGMAVFSRHGAVLEPDDSTMTISRALQVVSETIDEISGEEEGELDTETRFAITWFEAYQFGRGPFGEAESLAKARALSVAGVAEAGICKSGGGRVQLVSRSELPPDWDPHSDARPTVWEATQHLIKTLDEGGELAAAILLKQLETSSGLGAVVESVRLLAYRLYTVCVKNSWAEEASAYNRLVVSWPELARLAASVPASTGGVQEDLL